MTNDKLKEIQEWLHRIPTCPIHVMRNGGLTEEFVDWYQVRLPDWWKDGVRISGETAK